MKTFRFIPLLLLSNTLLFSHTIIKPDSYTNEGYCIVKSKKQQILGLSRFKTNKEFLQHCKGKMIFKYENDECRNFTMKNMNFNIYIIDKYGKYLFKIGKIKKVCGVEIIEEYIGLNKK